MKTRILLMLAMILVLAVTGSTAAAADPPEPGFYAVEEGGKCWLPNGDAKPTKVQEVKQMFRWVRPLRLEATCWGQLPKDAPRPKEALKLTFEATGYFCEVQFERMTMRTHDYGATVYPDGTSQIICRVDLD